MMPARRPAASLHSHQLRRRSRPALRRVTRSGRCASSRTARSASTAWSSTARTIGPPGS